MPRSWRFQEFNAREYASRKILFFWHEIIKNYVQAVSSCFRNARPCRKRAQAYAVTRPPALAGTFLVLLTVVLFPFTLVSPLPLSDYPNHVARMQIITHL